MRIRCLVLTIVIACAGPAHAQAPKPDAPAKTPEPRPEVSFLQVKIDASRSPIAMDTEAGLSAEIKNVSSVAVLLKENETVFVTMPEMRVYGEASSKDPSHAMPPVIQGCATFPTQHPAAGTKPGELLLQPNDSYRVFWDFGSNGCTGERLGKVRFWDDSILWFEQKWQRISFVPGKYSVYLDIVLYPKTETEANKEVGYRTATTSAEIQVSASQQMIILGSFLGGILAYVIKWYYGVPTAMIASAEDWWLKTAIHYLEWFFAGMFGAVMAILASRLSDTFPVKVSADDFWGAVTLGFIFQWIGVKLLEKLPGFTEPPKPKTTTP